MNDSVQANTFKKQETPQTMKKIIITSLDSIPIFWKRWTERQDWTETLMEEYSLVTRDYSRHWASSKAIRRQPEFEFLEHLQSDSNRRGSRSLEDPRIQVARQGDEVSHGLDAQTGTNQQRKSDHQERR